MMKSRVIEVVEGSPLDVLPSDQADLRRARGDLERRLRPRRPPFEDTPQGPVPRNVIGTLTLNPRTQIRVLPKVDTGADWIRACLDLMVPERASVAGNRRATRHLAQPSLESGLAVIYRDRLTRALRAEGPIEVMHEEYAHSDSLTGRLDVEKWAMGRAMRQFTFPVHRSVLDANNDFTAALALACTVLARSVEDGATRSTLVKLSRDLRPGLPHPTAPNPGALAQRLPSQWSSFDDAWSIAQVVLSNSGFASRHGTLSGVEVALEPWVLLEELLDRTVRHVVRRAQADGLDWRCERQATVQLLDPAEPGNGALARLLSPRVAHPENLIVGPEGVVASFEAKYSRPKGPEQIRGHMYQLLTTAAHAGSPCAVLVYPELAEPIHWTTASGRTSVRDVYAVGMDLFGYRAVDGCGARADMILDMVSRTTPVGPGRWGTPRAPSSFPAPRCTTRTGRSPR